ncbi:zinc ABC transporter ATP-binding protein AztA [Nocardioides lijunqiniae]|uniref:zinc ABC transporter ATP-binding protein AztA n=1 Tax=Nocardioides lijunqiniae TaxID=2760832 RepID=UPI001878A65A|nr:zinc ABC transporter ATP-binding protein AztA [Nocardioides lijunqiniae]
MTASVHLSSSPQHLSSMARLVGVGVSYGEHQALRHVDLRISRGRLTALTGANGAGKSTLIEVLAGVRPVTTGQVTRATGALAFVPQRTAVPDRLPVTVREVVTIGAWGEAGLWRRVGSAGRVRVATAMEVLGLTGLAHRSFGTLSGGEQQRALLAQGLARGAELLLIDEPTTGLDGESAAHIGAAIEAEVARGVTVVCVSHDDDVIARAARVVRLQDGRIVDDTEPA